MSQLFLAIAVLSLITWGAKHMFSVYYTKKRKEEINKLEARTAVLRMLLKAKLKRKGSQVQDQYKEEADFVASIISKLELLTTYNFNRTSDYEDVLSLLSSISEAIDFHTVQKNPAYYMAQAAQIQDDREQIIQDSSAEAKSAEPKTSAPASDKSKVAAVLPEFERWSQLFKYDKGNLYIIKEIVETTIDLKRKTEIYNQEHDKKDLHLRLPELIVITGFEGLKAIVDRDKAKHQQNKEERRQKRQQELLNPDLSDNPQPVVAVSGDDQNVA